MAYLLKAIGIPSQLKCKGSMPKYFKDFTSARIAMDATKATQDITSNMNKQSLTYSNYKSRQTVKAVTCFVLQMEHSYLHPIYLQDQLPMPP